MILKIIIWVYISHMSLINEHTIFGGCNISTKDLFIYIIASQALLSVLQVIYYIMLLICDAGLKDRYCWVWEFFSAWGYELDLVDYNLLNLKVSMWR
jgi:hypothetical protein